MKEPVEIGDVEKTGNAERGGVLFKVTNWKADSKIWPHDQMYGIYELSYGEQQIFDFVEIAFSDKEIKTLKDGVKGRYFIGMMCLDKKVCDFSDASPIPTHMQFTPAKTFEEIMLLQN